MTQAQLQTIEQIFHSALAQAPEGRADFLDAACAGDRLLRSQVEALLVSHQRATNFLETPAVDLATKILETTLPDPRIGQRIRHYKLCERIGAGGMGEVYLATDITAGRKAALKLLPARFTADPHRLQRFEQEARAVVALNHPNILTVYEIGEDQSTHYIASELIEGETLRQRLSSGPMAAEEAVEVAIQVASALVAAHGAGIVHRDIKPENIMLRPDGYVKVLDFGIAKLAEAEVASIDPIEGETSALQTRLGSAVGTMRYMSPEQLRGVAIDQRSDIWSLGVVLYEMITGTAPFGGGLAAKTRFEILEAEPLSLTMHPAEIPLELQQIIARTLPKEAAGRYASASELLAALKVARRQMDVEAATPAPAPARWRLARIAAAAVLVSLGIAWVLFTLGHREDAARVAAPEKSIAVLPFENLSTDPENAFFAAGVQEQILSNLAKIADLKVISRTSTQPYQPGQSRNSRQIGRDLGVAHLLEGSVQRTGDQLRIHAQLIDTRTDSHLWAQTYERGVADLFAVQAEIARSIAAQLNAVISEGERKAIAHPPTSDLLAHDLYAKALANDRSTPEDVRETVKLLEQAVARDPQFFLAYCALARKQFLLYGSYGEAKGLAAGEAALQKAAEIQPDAGEVHLLRARYLGLLVADYDRARAELELARRSLPNSAVLYAEMAYIDRRQGRWTEALMDFDRAIELDPRNREYLVNAGATYSGLRRYAEATSLFRRAVDLSPRDYEIRLFLAQLHYQERADLKPWRAELNRILAEDPAAATHISSSLLNCARLERDEAAAIRSLALLPPEGVPIRPKLVAPPEYYVALVAELFGRPADAEKAYLATRAHLQKVLAEQPENAPAWSMLGLVQAGLGQKEEAINAGRRACELLPLAREATAGGSALMDLVRIYVRVGENDLALQMLSSRTEDARMNYGYLALHPDWDTVRGDPRFQAYLARFAPPPPNR